ncbi:uncharacterized protein FA14DRAFT_159922 [Meira miltonrushii]|uniref:Endopeptidase S2P n=1 Tax=Meira miltonrushii TaxID=1280837 RepID=A0A316VL94_9BASI|nr:uncharacterized protein FA14DRAFT_159922 [Meira miltonrushii]PWN38287.1 hypothetical protein FA14DRAFT_159922 [Meira miltonrushii]
MAIATLVQGIIVLSLPWLALELIDFYIRNHGLNKNIQIPLIQFYSHRIANNLSISRGTFWIKLETTAFNTLPENFLNRIIGSKSFSNLPYDREDISQRSRQNGTAKSNRSKLLSRLYDLGIVFAFLAFFASLTIIVWGAFVLIGDIVGLMQTQPVDVIEKSVEAQATEMAQVYGNIQRRQLSTNQAMTPTPQDSNTSAWTPNLKPLIPGLTLPWTHLLPLVIALVVTQVLHEAGHAICGTLHDLPPLRTGIMFLYPIIPGAFVVLPRTASSIGPANDDAEEDENQSWQELERGLASEEEDEDFYPHVSLREKMQIVSAGVWHNALTAIILAVFLVIPVGSFIHTIFFYDSGALRVQKVRSSSPLAMHLSSGAIITHLDDIDLTESTSKSGEKRSLLWDQYLAYEQTDTVSPVVDQGWCVAPHIWKSSPATCCEKFVGGQTQRSTEDDSTSALGTKLCFVTNDRTQGRCYDPVFLVEGKAERCIASCPFTDVNGYPAESICVRPDSREELLRITVQEQMAGKTKERVVLFQGNRYAVHLALDVSPYAFRLWSGFRWPGRLFNLMSMIFNYSLTLSVAMALFNMLPLPTLDGDVFLTMLFAYWFSPLDQSASVNGVEQHRKADDRLSSSNVAEDSLSKSRHNRQGSMSESARNRANGGSNGTSSKRDDDERGAAKKPAFQPRKPRIYVQSGTISQIHKRINWATLFLTIFVFGGSVVMHIIKTD